jgi:hypothetical protein
MAETSVLASRGLQYRKRGVTPTIARVVAGLLMTIGVVTGWEAVADPALESLEQMQPQRPGMKAEEDYQRFVQEHGLPQRSEPTPADMDWLRAQSLRARKVEEEYSRRNSTSLSHMSDEEILNAIRLKIESDLEPPSVDAYEDWPKSPGEFEKKYGRPPQRREEMDFYFGGDDDMSQDEECK